MPAIPVTIIGGYLGAGKTTLVNQALRQANGLRLAVLVNEFGDLSIDADLIESASDNVINIAGGCVCCAYGSDLIAALLDLKQLVPAPEHILLEASGVAMPHAIGQSVQLVVDYSLDSIIVVADAHTVEQRGTDEYLADTITGQLQAAQLVILNQCDRVTSQEHKQTRQWVRTQAPNASIVDTVNAQVPLSTILGSHLEQLIDGPGTTHNNAHEQHANHHAKVFGVDHPVDVHQLAKGLSDAAIDLIRSKGFVIGIDGQVYNVQTVGRRWQVSATKKEVTTTGHLVCIRFRHPIDANAIERVIANSNATDDRAQQLDRDDA